jgi:hypothetical protein
MISTLIEEREIRVSGETLLSKFLRSILEEFLEKEGHLTYVRNGLRDGEYHH